MRLQIGVTAPVFLASALLLPSPASAQGLGPIPGEEKFAQMTQEQGENSGGAGIGYWTVDDDHFIQLQIRTELNLGPVGIGFQVPLNLRVHDNPPEAENDYYGVIREEDWDEPSEYLRAIRYVRLGHKRDDFYLRVGELAAEIGHGTIMSRYMNNIDLNTTRVGAQFDINTNYGGFETIVGDVGSILTETPESRIVGLRAYIKPMALADPESFLNIFAIGATVISDMNAPKEVSGELDGDGNFKVLADEATTVYGVDLEIELLHTAILDIIPYTDYNVIDGAGWGLHLGTLITAKMPIGFELTIPLRVEYRRFQSNYVPIFFDNFYEIQRYSWANSGVPKGEALRLADSDEGISGYYADLAFDFAGIVQFGAIYEDYEGAEPNLAAFVNVPALEVMQFKAYYARTAIEGTDDILVFDDRSLGVAQARYEMYPFVYVVGRFTRRWVPKAGLAANSPAQFEAKDEYNIGVELDFDF